MNTDTFVRPDAFLIYFNCTHLHTHTHASLSHCKTHTQAHRKTRTHTFFVRSFIAQSSSTLAIFAQCAAVDTAVFVCVHACYPESSAISPVPSADRVITRFSSSSTQESPHERYRPLFLSLYASEHASAQAAIN